MKNKVILRGFRDLSNNWRSRWLRLGTGSELTHCTLSIGDLTLHVDYKGSNWYPTIRLFNAYDDIYQLDTALYLGEVKRPVYIRPDAGSTLSVVKWKYLFGPRPQCCSTACIDALRQNGFECPELIVPHKLIDYFDNDYIRTER